ncbi:helix-turn-helix domain-containing protein [Maribacter arenosus]|uniref:Helix-turn-helix transcriptional regulator n=1 Tax=Maribacter arenosus TaxID=1854708 RepID=A0ABR7VDH1_9FLAO|nr:helix-turn-helix transcriptional regulator [Maribacter arenosus]MBD0851418.1 helix-turn-helix transcriptional regulator [Maribacter arenosus]
MKDIINIDSISSIHKALGLSSPAHPLISVISTRELKQKLQVSAGKFSFDLYIISLKEIGVGAFQYGRKSYDYQDSSLIFTAPGQVMQFEEDQNQRIQDGEGWDIFFHPDFIRHSPLASTISDYSFFEYENNEALHVSEKEKKILLDFVTNIANEIDQNIDKHTQELIIINLESILKYSKRFYDRQFYTRSNYNHDYLVKFEKFLKNYFTSHLLVESGLPTVQQCGEALHLSGYYLSDLLKVETGKTAKEHILLHMVKEAKTKLLNSNSSVSEIAYDFGFEYPQHFSKVFKSKTGFSPSEYRNLN